jgi:serine/threonine-protein kinase
MLNLGDSVDRYVIEAVLGEGGMGRVYRALDPRLGRRVALKVLLADGVSPKVKADAALRMMREARAAAAFSHPNVVAIHDVGEIEGAPYITMELVSGTTLRDYVGDPNVSAPQKLEWLQHVARGLGAAHRAGLVHRDIKPENVMVTTDGLVKILDFGIARRAEDLAIVDSGAPTAAAPLASLTAEGMTLGTPQYMSPEQLQAASVDGRTDQFAWGVMAWELFVGALPWGAARNGAQLVAAVLAMPVPPLVDAAPGVSAKVSEVVARSLSKERDRRFATMDELLAALQGKPADLPTPVSQGAAFEATALQPRTPAAMADGAGVQLIPAQPSVSTTAGSAIAVAPTERPIATARRPRWLRWAVIVALILTATGVPSALRRFVGAGNGGNGGSGRRAPADDATPMVGACAAGTKNDCSADSSAWCDVEGHVVACCAAGLAAMGTDGVCDCPPGGSEPDAGVAACPKKATTTGVANAGAVIAALRPKFRACYNRGLTANQSLEGRATIELTIAPDGRVFHARVAEGRMASQSVQRCLLDELRKSTFDPPPGGRSSLTIPVSFVTTNDAAKPASN